MKLPPLSSVRTFEVAARKLSFSKAGDELHVTHAAVSHQIRNLEDWLGATLFERHGRGVKLTRAGGMLFRQVAPALVEIADACAIVRTLGGKESLSVGCIPSIASRWLVPNLTDFTMNHPDLDVRVVYANSEEKIGDGPLDVLITTGRDENEDVASHRLFSRESRPVCSPAFLAEKGPFNAAQKIAVAPLLHDEDRDGWQRWFHVAGQDWKPNDNWPVYQDFNLLATAVIAGHGIALCPVEVFRNEISRGDLVVLSEIEINSERSYFAHSRNAASDAARAFILWFAGLTKTIDNRESQ